jgi:hypothetical protein
MHHTSGAAAPIDAAQTPATPMTAIPIEPAPAAFTLVSVTRGGWLTIANCAAWAVFMFFRGQWPQPVGKAFFYAIGTPLVVPLEWWERSGGSLSVVVILLAIALNSMLWGYTLSWLWGATVDRPRQRRRRRAGLCAACGYDLRGSTTGVCTECGAQ